MATAVRSIADTVVSGLGLPASRASKCVANRVKAVADGIKARANAHAKARRRYSPERFARLLVNSGSALAASYAAAEKLGDCPVPLSLDEIRATVDAAVQRLLEKVYGCEAVGGSEVVAAAGGKWPLLLKHAEGLGYDAVNHGVLCPRTPSDDGAPPVMAQATLAASDGSEVVAGFYPDLGVSMLMRRDEDASVTLFHWLGGVRISPDGTFHAVDETGGVAAPLQARGLFAPCKEARSKSNRCWVTFCNANVQNLAACLEMRTCLGLGGFDPFDVLTAPIQCQAASQTISTAPCPKFGEDLTCTLPGEDDECPLEGKCNILDVCRLEKHQASDGEACTPDRPTRGRQGPFCVDDRRLIKTRCELGRCAKSNKPITCFTGCCGADGEARCWEGPGSCLCGNNRVDDGEVCDDGNDVPDDGCDNCKLSEGESFWWVWAGPFGDNAFVRAGTTNGPDNYNDFFVPQGPVSSVNEFVSSEVNAPENCQFRPEFSASVSTSLNANLSPFSGTIRARVDIDRKWCGPGRTVLYNNGTSLHLYHTSLNNKRFRYTIRGQWGNDGSCLLYAEHERPPFSYTVDVPAGGPVLCPDGVLGRGCARVEFPTVPIWGDDGPSPATCSSVIQGTVSFTAEPITD